MADIIDQIHAEAAAPVGDVVDQIHAENQPQGFDVGDTLKQYAHNMNPVTAAEGIAGAVRHPLDALSSYGKQNQDIADKATAAFKKGDYGEGVRHSLMYLLNGIPGVGSMLDRAGDKAGSGDYSGAIADTAALATQIAAGKIIPAAAETASRPGFAGDVAAATGGALKGAAKGAVEPVAHHLLGPVPASVVGAATGHLVARELGLPGELGAVAGATGPIIRGGVRGAKAALAERAAAVPTMPRVTEAAPVSADAPGHAGPESISPTISPIAPGAPQAPAMSGPVRMDDSGPGIPLSQGKLGPRQTLGGRQTPVLPSSDAVPAYEPPHPAVAALASNPEALETAKALKTQAEAPAYEPPHPAISKLAGNPDALAKAKAAKGAAEALRDSLAEPEHAPDYPGGSDKQGLPESVMDPNTSGLQIQPYEANKSGVAQAFIDHLKKSGQSAADIAAEIRSRADQPAAHEVFWRSAAQAGKVTRKLQRGKPEAYMPSPATQGKVLDMLDQEANGTAQTPAH